MTANAGRWPIVSKMLQKIGCVKVTFCEDFQNNNYQPSTIKTS